MERMGANEDYARWLLDDASIRAAARRQLKFGVPVLVIAMFAAAFAFGSPPSKSDNIPTSHHAPTIVPVYPTAMVG